MEYLDNENPGTAHEELKKTQQAEEGQGERDSKKQSARPALSSKGKVPTVKQKRSQKAKQPAKASQDTKEVVIISDEEDTDFEPDSKIART